MQKEMSYAAYAGIGVEGSSTIKAMILMECLHRGETSGSPSYIFLISLAHADLHCF